MKTVHVAVCDDEKKALSIISASVEAVFSEEGVETEIATCLSPMQLLEHMNHTDYELIFLDICMSEMDGIELGRKITAAGGSSSIVFVSSRMDRMYDTFAIQPFGFVRKGNFMDDINEVIHRYIEQEKKPKEAQTVHFRDRQGEIITVNIDKLRYIECYKNVQEIHICGNEIKKIYSRMEILEETLKKYGFIRTHKGYLVNCKYIKRFDSKKVTLLTGEELPIGRSRYHEAMDGYMSYIGTHGILLG